MQASNAPTKVSVPFADAGAKQTIPVDSQIGVQDGRASYVDGFPPLTRTPIVAGGIPPFGTDMNGILYAITNVLRWQNSGGTFTFDAALATDIGGYPSGALLLKDDGSGFWLCTQDDNSNDPDTGGSGWVDALGSGQDIVVFDTAGVTNWSVPEALKSGVRKAHVTVIGGGGGGGGVRGSNGAIGGGQGGGGGGAASGLLDLTGETSIPVTVGSFGGTGNGGNNYAGQPGGSSSFGSFISATGGSGGNTLEATTNVPTIIPGTSLSGAGTGGDVQWGGGVSSEGSLLSINVSDSVSGGGGDSPLGGNVRGRNVNGPGFDATHPGAGGGGALSDDGNNYTGGRGYNGLVIVRW